MEGQLYSFGWPWISCTQAAAFNENSCVRVRESVRHAGKHCTPSNIQCSCAQSSFQVPQKARSRMSPTVMKEPRSHPSLWTLFAWQELAVPPEWTTSAPCYKGQPSYDFDGVHAIAIHKAFMKGRQMFQLYYVWGGVGRWVDPKCWPVCSPNCGLVQEGGLKHVFILAPHPAHRSERWFHNFTSAPQTRALWGHRLNA